MKPILRWGLGALLAAALCIGLTPAPVRAGLTNYVVFGAGASNFAYFSTNATVTHRTGAGVLRRLIIANLPASPSCIAIYDNTAGSGTQIAQICPSTTNQAVYEINVKVSMGITTVQSGATASGATIIWDQ